jgi:amphi-Trp domain-containing protein
VQSDEVKEKAMPQHPGHQKEEELGWHMTGSAREIGDILAEFAQELRGGDVNVWKGQRELHLSPEGKVSLQVEAIVDEDGREGFHMKLHWTNTSATADMHSGANMGIEVGGQGRKLGDQRKP